MNYDGETLISLDRGGAHIVSPAIAEKLAKKNLSPSTVSSMTDCTARWIADQYVVREVVAQEPDNAARRGSLFHKTMENLFAYPKEERTQALMKKMVKETLMEPDFVDLSTNKDVVMWLRQAVNGYYIMGGDPTKVEIATIMQRGEPKSGIELFVKGQVGDTSRPILGFIDQLIEDPTRDDGSVIIQDWKTGAKAKKWNPKTKSEDGLGEQRQQIIYSHLLRQDGVKVSGARLIFPVAQEVVNVDLGDERLYNRVINDVEEADKILDSYIENNTFDTKPGFLCAWCPLAKICPSATIKPYDKMVAAYATQPAPEILRPAIELL